MTAAKEQMRVFLLGRGVRSQFVAAAAVIAVVPLLILLISHYLLGIRREERESAVQVDVAARTISAAVSQTLRHYLASLESLASTWTDSDALESPDLSEPLARWHAHFPGILRMVVADGSGQTIAASPLVGADGLLRARRGQSVADRDYFQRAFFDDRPFVSGVFKARGAGNVVVVALAAPLHDRAGKAVGVVEASLDLGKLSDVAQLFQGIEEAEVLIFDRERHVVFATPRTGLSPLDPVPPSFQSGPSIEAGAVSDAGWTVVVRQPRGVLRRTEARLAVQAGLVAVVSLAVILLLARLLTGPTTRSLESLAEGLNRVASGEVADGALGGEPNVVVEPTAPVEVRRVADHFNVMARRRRHLQRVLDGLEETVAERTSELRASEEKFARAFHSNPAPMALTSVPEGRFLDVNEAFLKTFGFLRGEMIGRTALEFGFFDDEPRHVAALQDVLAHGKVHDFEARVSTKDGTVRLGVFSGDVIELKGGPVILTVMDDITESRRVEEALRSSHEELERRVEARTRDLEASKRELEAFSYTVSHDLRAPLRAIDGFTHLLGRKLEEQLDEEGRRLLGSVGRNARRMGKLIDGLLQFLRAGRTRLGSHPIDMEGLFRATLNQLIPDDERARLDIRIAPLPPAFGDRELVRVVVENLLSNAVKFSRSRPRPSIEVGCRESESGPEYFVRDNGVGFDPKYGDKLFGVFEHLHGIEEFEGTGMGLALVKRIVERHGGRVGAEGKVDGGATFWFSLGPGLPGEIRA